MLRKALDILFVGAVAAVCAYALVASWTLGGTAEEYGMYVALALMVAVLATGVRTCFALRGPREGGAAAARIAAGPVLLAITVVLLATSTPDRARLAYSMDSLNAYAGTVAARDCDPRYFSARRVGLYTVTCATSDGHYVRFHLRDRLTPDGVGTCLMYGSPGGWDFEIID
ncbi:hypothetical protein [Actinomadura kijaniata]|uniref:hypothetical protein n=1 Tax=Actinomadura kijaniata TaxID=46161 RepID=UPI00082F2D7A|nr:hypothetical protein [Actinomadura kijaniata]